MKIFLTLMMMFQLWFYTLEGGVEKLVIVGGGPSGLTAALFAGQASLNPLVIEGSPALSQYASVSKVENFPGFPEGISGQELHLKLEEQAKKCGAILHKGQVTRVDLSSRPFSIELSDGSTIQAESLIVATGSSPKWLGLDSEKRLMGRGVSANALLEGPLCADQEVIVVGAGDSAMDQALTLAEYASQVTIIYKGNSFFASSYLQEKVLSHPKIHVLFGKQVMEVLGQHAGHVQGVMLMDVQTGEKLELLCQGIFVAQGRLPNTEFLKGEMELSPVGEVITFNKSTQTSVPGVFVAGDIAIKSYKKMITAAASGCMAAIEAIQFLKERG